MVDLITIIVPVYKVEDYLHRCINSLLRQTYKNLEIILVDDGSPDQSGEICDQYAMDDDRIKVIHKANGGLSDARNAGIEQANGTFISFLDSDDWVADHYAETLHELAVTRGAEISVCHFIKTEVEEINGLGSPKEIFEFTNIEALHKLCEELYVQLTISCGKLYKAELFEGIRFPPGKIHEDEYTTYKLLYKAKGVVVTTEQLLYYWQRHDSIMGNGFIIKNKMFALEAFEERASFFHQIGQTQLMNMTYKSLFLMYREINCNIRLCEDGCAKKVYDKKYEDFKIRMRKTKQSLKFKVFYEIYFFSPALACNIQSLIKKQ